MERPLPNIDDLKANTAHDLILSDQEIEQRHISSENLFQIRINGEIEGPILKEDLQDYVQTINLNNAEVKNIVAQEWTKINNHPLFQRRMPKIVTSTTLKDFQSPIYILKNGEKSGPYNTDKIIDKFEKEELLVTDMISENGINNWTKLYEIKEFDRRAYDQLPHLPKNEIFTMTAPIIEDGDYQQAEIEAIVGLAYVSNIKSGMKESTYTENTQAKIKTTETILPDLSAPTNKRKFIKPLLGASIILSLLAGYIFISNMPSPHGPKVTKQRSKTYATKKKQPTIHKLKPQRRAPATTTRKIKPIKARIKKRTSKSFKESPAYKKYKQRQATANIESEEITAQELELELEAEEFDPEYPVDEINLDEEMDDISDEEVEEFVKSIHGGFSVRSNEESEDELSDSEDQE